MAALVGGTAVSVQSEALKAAILEDRRPLLLRRCVPAAAVDAWAAAMLDESVPAERPLVPLEGEDTVSNERNARGALPTTARSLLAGDSAGQLRTDAPAVDELGPLLAGLEDEGVTVRRAVAFVMSARLRTPMHSDADDGLLVHCRGEKRFVLAPPTAFEVLERYSRTSGAHDDVFRGADGLVSGELRPGDALYLPRRWLHDVESRTATLSVALRFDLPCHMAF